MNLSRRFIMVSVLMWSVTMTLVVILTGLVALLFLYRMSGPPQTGGGVQPGETATSITLVAGEQRANPTVTDDKNKLVKLLEKLDLKDCDSYLAGSSSTELQRPAAHTRAHDDLLNFPKSRFHRDIRFNTLSPAGVRHISGFYGVFHLNWICRRDNELHVHWKLKLRTNTEGHKTEPLACWTAGSSDLHAQSGRRYFREPGKHMNVGILQRSSDTWRSQSCFVRTSSCRFYLCLHRDDVTAPPPRFMAAARRNSENVAPSMPDAAKLADFLLSLDANYKVFMSFFKWRQFYNARRRRSEEEAEFLLQQ